MPAMTDRNLRIVVAGLVAMLLVVIVAIVLVVNGRNEPAASTTPSFSPGASPSAAASASPSVAPSPSPSDVSPSASSSAGPSGSPLPAPLATATFLGLKLDATDDPGAQPRIISFRSDGPGLVTAKLVSKAPQGTTHMCLQVGAKVVGCNDIASGSFTGTTGQAHANWQVTLEGTGAAAPIVDLTVTFQALTPSVKIEHARFDGTAFPDTNGVGIRLTVRAAGDVRLVADWGGHPFPYEVDLFDDTSGTGNATFPNQGPSTNVDQTIPVGAGDWRVVLQNTETGFGTTDLTATLSWP
jgi:hypothetical protein